MSCCGQTVVEQVTHGVVGLAKAALGIDKTPVNIATARLRQCAGHPTGGEDAIEPCPAYAPVLLGLAMGCTDCGCSVAAKLRIASETCPRNRWPVGE